MLKLPMQPFEGAKTKQTKEIKRLMNTIPIMLKIIGFHFYCTFEAVVTSQNLNQANALHTITFKYDSFFLSAQYIQRMQNIASSLERTSLVRTDGQVDKPETETLMRLISYKTCQTQCNNFFQPLTSWIDLRPMFYDGM